MIISLSDVVELVDLELQKSLLVGQREILVENELLEGMATCHAPLDKFILLACVKFPVTFVLLLVYEYEDIALSFKVNE